MSSLLGVTGQIIEIRFWRVKCRLLLQEVAADKLDSEGDKCTNQEKAKHQKRFNTSSDEKEVGIIWTMDTYIEWKITGKLKLS